MKMTLDLAVFTARFLALCATVADADDSTRRNFARACAEMIREANEHQPQNARTRYCASLATALSEALWEEIGADARRVDMHAECFGD